MSLAQLCLIGFTGCYVVALALESLRVYGPGHPALGVWSRVIGIAGIAAHALYFAGRPIVLASSQESMLFVALVLGIFYVAGAIHHRRIAWGLFVLPLVLILIALAQCLPASPNVTVGASKEATERLLGPIHGSLLLLAAVGVCVGVIASLMYLVQATRLRAKAMPDEGLRMLSLERLEEMNRRALDWAFPLLTGGVAVGMGLVLQRTSLAHAWGDPRIVGACLLWAVFAVVLFLRHARGRVRGRRLALWTIVAFCLLMLTLASTHTAIPGGGR